VSTEMTVYQSLAPEHAAVATRAEERIKARTVVTVIENRRDLLEVKNALGHGLFTQWLAQTFPFTERTAQRWMSAAERYGAKSEVTSVLKSEVLLLLAAPSTPEEVRQEIEARAIAGERITVAEVERLKREANAAREAAARLETERADLLTRVTDASSREREARDHLSPANRPRRRAITSRPRTGRGGKAGSGRCCPRGSTRRGRAGETRR
jgi:hypothetical protein